MQNSWSFLKKNKIKKEYKYDLAILLLDIYPKQLKSGSVRDKDLFRQKYIVAAAL